MTALATELAAHGPGWYGTPGWNGPPVWVPIVGGTLWLLFWATVITIAVVFWRRHARSRPTAGDSAVAVLGERFARGEIGEEEYRERRGVLRE